MTLEQQRPQATESNSGCLGGCCGYQAENTPRRTLLIAIVVLATCGCAASRPTPAAAPVVAAQTRPLQIGDAPLVYEETEETEAHRYVGGTAYVLVKAAPDEVMALLDPTDCYWHVLPRVWDVKPVGNEGQDKLVELEQGTSLVRGRYTVKIRTTRQPPLRYLLQFWLDTTRPHSLKDAYGSLTLEPYGPKQTLVTWRIRIDLGAGFVRWFFEEKIRRVALTTPYLVRDYVHKKIAEGNSDH